jgi:hypothetical protein
MTKFYDVKITRRAAGQFWNFQTFCESAAEARRLAALTFSPAVFSIECDDAGAGANTADAVPEERQAELF